jgi:hypothetical protein
VDLIDVVFCVDATLRAFRHRCRQCYCALKRELKAYPFADIRHDAVERRANCTDEDSRGWCGGLYDQRRLGAQIEPSCDNNDRAADASASNLREALAGSTDVLETASSVRGVLISNFKCRVSNRARDGVPD